MAKRPNAMGRIEGEPKKPFPWKNVMTVVLGIALVVAGVAGTLGYQKYIDNIKAEGVAQYKIDNCQKYTNEDKSATWLECDAFRVENNQ